MINTAAKEAFALIKRRPASTDLAKLYWATRLLRAARSGSDWGIRVAVIAWPELAEHLDPHDHHIHSSLHGKVIYLADAVAEQELLQPPKPGTNQAHITACSSHFKYGSTHALESHSLASSGTTRPAVNLFLFQVLRRPKLFETIGPRFSVLAKVTPMLRTSCSCTLPLPNLRRPMFPMQI